MTIHTPLIDLTKAEIIRQGASLGVDYCMTVSCYQADEEGRACGVCDSCRIRKEGFAAAGLPDPTKYRQNLRNLEPRRISPTIPPLLRGSLAQLVEHRTFNPMVVGSNPTRPTIFSIFLSFFG